MAENKKGTVASNIVGRKLPYNFEAEQAVLGAVLISQEAPSIILSELKEDDFLSKEHQIIFGTMQTLFIKKNHTYFDHIILTSELESKGLLDAVGGISYLLTLTDKLPSSTNFQYYVDIVKRDSILRKLIQAGGEIIEDAYTSDDMVKSLQSAENSIYKISQVSEHSSLEHIRSSLEKVIADFELCFQNPNAKRGLETGLVGLDHYTNGFQKGDLIILAARPSFGKSALALNMVQHMAVKCKKSCAVFSLEMPKEQLSRRMACSISGVDMAKVLRGDLEDEQEQRRFRQAISVLADAPIFIDDSSMNTPAEILSKCRRLKNDPAYGLDFVMIDYLQLMNVGPRSKADSRQQEVSEISRSLKVIAKELNVPVLALSQLSRAVESRTGDHKPQLSDLRETGSIEQDADIVMFIHRPSRYQDTNKNQDMDQSQAFLVLAKHRNGALGDIPMHWDGGTTTFTSTARDLETASLESTAPPPISEKSKRAFEKIARELQGNSAEIDDIFDSTPPPIPPAPTQDDMPYDVPNVEPAPEPPFDDEIISAVTPENSQNNNPNTDDDPLFDE